MISNVRSGIESPAIALWDAGSTLCFITFDMAKKLELRGEPVKLDIVTVGGGSKEVDSLRYMVALKDIKGVKVKV